MPKLEYPKELTPAWWDKKKPVLAKTKKTGIGEALTALKKAYDPIKWEACTTGGAVSSIDQFLTIWPKQFADVIKPLADKAKEVQKVAQKASADFAKEKMIPKSAAAAADTVAEAAKNYADEVLDFEGLCAKEAVRLRKELVAERRGHVKPAFVKALAKIEGLIKDLGVYGRNPTKEQFWKLFSGDGNARGYTTACQNWDQLLIEYPEMRDQCFKGKAMDYFFPGMRDYGANWAEAEFESKVNPKTGKTKEDEIYRQHAIIMLKQGPKIKEFKAVVQKLLKLLDEK